MEGFIYIPTELILQLCIWESLSVQDIMGGKCID